MHHITAKVRLMNPDRLCLDLLRRIMLLPPLISQFITMLSDVPFNPTKVTDGNKSGFWHIPFVDNIQ